MLAYMEGLRPKYYLNEVRERVSWKENQPFRAFHRNISNIPILN